MGDPGKCRCHACDVMAVTECCFQGARTTSVKLTELAEEFEQARPKRSNAKKAKKRPHTGTATFRL